MGLPVVTKNNLSTFFYMSYACRHEIINTFNSAGPALKDILPQRGLHLRYLMEILQEKL